MKAKRRDELLNQLDKLGNLGSGWFWRNQLMQLLADVIAEIHGEKKEKPNARD